MLRSSRETEAPTSSLARPSSPSLVPFRLRVRLHAGNLCLPPPHTPPLRPALHKLFTSLPFSNHASLSYSMLPLVNPHTMVTCQLSWTLGRLGSMFGPERDAAAAALAMQGGRVTQLRTSTGKRSVSSGLSNGGSRWVTGTPTHDISPAPQAAAAPPL
jgi:hypothetical protein